MGDIVKGKQCPVHKNYPPNSMTNDIIYVINVGWDCEWSNYMCSQQPAHIALDEHRALYYYSNSAKEWYRKPVVQGTFTIPPTAIEPKIFIKMDMFPHKCPRCGGACYIGINTDHELAARNDTCK